MTDPRARRRLVRAIETAARQQQADPAYGAEIADWSGRPAGARDGVPADRAAGTEAVPGRMPMRAFAGAAASGPSSGEPESATLLLLHTAVDTPLLWLRVGEVTSALLLTATGWGLGASPLTQPLEVSGTWTFLRDHVARSSAAHPQMLLRIGWPQADAPPLHVTPRRPLAEVVDS